MKISEFRTDEKKEQEGVWIDVGAGLELLLARLPNAAYEDFITDTSTKRLQTSAIGLKSRPLKEVVKKAIAKFVLLDWRNLQDDEGNDVPYSEEKALEYLEIPDFYRTVERAASERSNYINENMAALEGN